jgi:hypothetical protein
MKQAPSKLGAPAVPAVRLASTALAQRVVWKPAEKRVALATAHPTFPRTFLSSRSTAAVAETLAEIPALAASEASPARAESLALAVELLRTRPSAPAVSREQAELLAQAEWASVPAGSSVREESWGAVELSALVGLPARAALALAEWSARVELLARVALALAEWSARVELLARVALALAEWSAQVAPVRVESLARVVLSARVESLAQVASAQAELLARVEWSVRVVLLEPVAPARAVQPLGALLDPVVRPERRQAARV